jgi:hypothetical protein
LEEAVVNAEILSERRRQEAETAAKKITVQAHIATLQKAVSKASSGNS